MQKKKGNFPLRCFDIYRSEMFWINFYKKKFCQILKKLSSKVGLDKFGRKIFSIIFF